MGYEENAMGATDRLVQFITDTQYDTLPEEVVSAAKIGIMDVWPICSPVPLSSRGGYQHVCTAAWRRAAMQCSWGTICRPMPHRGLRQRGLLPAWISRSRAAADPWYLGRIASGPGPGRNVQRAGWPGSSRRTVIGWELQALVPRASCA